MDGRGEERVANEIDSRISCYESRTSELSAPSVSSSSSCTEAEGEEKEERGKEEEHEGERRTRRRERRGGGERVGEGGTSVNGNSCPSGIDIY